MKKVKFYTGNNSKYDYFLLEKKIGKSSLAENLSGESSGLIVNENGIQSNFNYVLIKKDKLGNYITFIGLDSNDDFEIIN